MAGTKTEIRDGVWRLRVVIGKTAAGNPRQASRTFRGGPREADKALAKMVTDADKGRLSVNSYSIKRLLDEFVEHAKSTGRAATTTTKYGQLAKNVINPVIGDTKLSKLTARDLDKLYASLTARGNSPATVRRVHALIAVALHQATKWGLVDRSVALLASPPPVRGSELTAPTREQVALILEKTETILVDETDPSDRQAESRRLSELFADAFVLAALTGARRGEIAGLRWGDWDMTAGTLRVERSVYEVTGGGWDVKDVKNHAGRTVTLDDRAVRALSRLWEAATTLADALGGWCDLGDLCVDTARRAS